MIHTYWSCGGYILEDGTHTQPEQFIKTKLNFLRNLGPLKKKNIPKYFLRKIKYGGKISALLGSRPLRLGANSPIDFCIVSQLSKSLYLKF